MDLKLTEDELKKRFAIPYSWKGSKQLDELDKKTNFIYSTLQFNELLEQINDFKDHEQFDLLKNYSLNRWYNFHSAKAMEQIFCTIPGVLAAQNNKDRFFDFEIQGIHFDLKTTIFPFGFKRNIKDAMQQPEKLIEWFYDNQSSEKRQHYENRLFIVLFDNKNKEHWKLKAELNWLKSIIEKYVQTFDADRLHIISFNAKRKAQSDIIWAIR